MEKGPEREPEEVKDWVEGVEAVVVVAEGEEVRAAEVAV